MITLIDWRIAFESWHLKSADVQKLVLSVSIGHIWFMKGNMIIKRRSCLFNAIFSNFIYTLTRIAKGHQILNLLLELIFFLHASIINWNFSLFLLIWVSLWWSLTYWVVYVGWYCSRKHFVSLYFQRIANSFFLGTLCSFRFCFYANIFCTLRIKR